MSLPILQMRKQRLGEVDDVLKVTEPGHFADRLSSFHDSIAFSIIIPNTNI